ncbi:zinc-binding dehydrogenase (plasmid) [Rhizobium sp. WL3]|uniref:alcohol dehydrogenase family protein n=1 Tax=Rhizobium sp. WL3 TaxID=2603277 RepID=UPI0011C1E7F8|nr:alcohol dehydrogenase family protein [Rhizobium sp. WL3]QEE43523.1 zinc-binding dehydrogenase [Rhizobium sp. WL3]
MKAIVTTGTGGYEKLACREVPVPVPAHGEVLIEVLAAGVNNTDINTRLGWYSSAVRSGTVQADDGAERSDGGWNAALRFPLIQGADCCGRIVAAGSEEDAVRIGERVIIRSCMRTRGFGHMETVWLGSDFNGAFAQYVKAPAAEVFAVDCNWTSEELASIPCAYGTAENMIERAGIGKGAQVLVPGASGGVGSAVVQLAKRRGAKVIAITSAGKSDVVKDIGADKVLARGDDFVAALGKESVDVVIDNVAGTAFGHLLKVLRRGGRYVSSGAIAGPIVELDLRDMYLKDIALIGCTAWDEPVFQNLVSYIEAAEIRPLVAATYPMERIAEAQAAFGQKEHAGKIVLLPGA